MTLAEFLTARLDEDEAAARAASTDGRASWHTDPHAMHESGVVDDAGDIVVYDEGAPTHDEAAHIARHDPARVLREVAAKRAVVAAAAWVGVKRASDDPLGMATDSGADGQGHTLDWVLRHLAAVYSDVPGYDEAWRP